MSGIYFNICDGNGLAFQDHCLVDGENLTCSSEFGVKLQKEFKLSQIGRLFVNIIRRIEIVYGMIRSYLFYNHVRIDSERNYQLIGHVVVNEIYTQAP